jgi:GNAT superfamily N-acetyltransferase
MAAVRRARLADAPAIARVHVDSWRAAYLGLVPSAVLDALSVERRRASWANILGGGGAIDGSRAWVATVGARTVGFVSAGPSRDQDDAGKNVGEVYAIYLEPAAWGHGLGSDLLEAAEDDLSLRGMKTVTLWVLEGNPRARRFYEIAGYTLDGKRAEEEVGPAKLPSVRYRKRI